MLSLSLEPDDYITINGNTVVKYVKTARGRCFLAIDADKSIPIVRGAVLERMGGERPACLNRPREKEGTNP